MNQPTHSPQDADGALDAALRRLHRNVLVEPVPNSIMMSAERLDALRSKGQSRWNALSVAAALVMAFGIGWLSNGLLRPINNPSVALAVATPVHEFVLQAGYAYAAYMPEKRHPVEVAAADQDHLVQWLSKRLGRPLKVPQLTTEGFELVGGRLLPGPAGTRAQFMYQNQQGLRLTLYLGAIESSDNAEAPNLQAAQFRYEPQGPVPSFYWADQGFGYALSGPVDSTTLMTLARTVYKQLAH